ncbi:hypothetical protein ACFL7D_12305 [candidate division KSB1 bacterium]
MSDEYKKQIIGRIKKSINDWIEELKTKHPELLLTKQWNVVFPRGFSSGNNVIPVVTSSKKGKHLVGEVCFALPDNLELDMDAIELTLKNEPYKKTAKKKTITPAPLDEPLDTLNDLILNLNEFLKGFAVPISTNSNPAKTLFPGRNNSPFSNPVTIRNGIKVTSGNNGDRIDSVKNELMHTPYLPEWFKTIESLPIRSQLLEKIAESLIHYENQLGRKVDLKEFFGKYTEHLLKQNKLYRYCKYKAKPVSFDTNNLCTDNYCSKKPYRDVCPQGVLKFGSKSLEDL